MFINFYRNILGAAYISTMLVIKDRFSMLRCSYTAMYAALRRSKIGLFCHSLAKCKQSLVKMPYRKVNYLIKRTGLLVAILLAGCTTTTLIKQPPPPPSLAGQPYAFKEDTAEVQLAEAASSISASLLNLAEVQQAATPARQPIQSPNPGNYGMGQLVSVDWNGPIEPLIQKISGLTNYNLRVLGTPPAIPIVMAINEKNIPIGRVLQNIGYQAGSRADIIVYPSTHVIELRYAAS